MIPNPLDKITVKDFTNLIANGVSEGRTIEYKRELPGASDADKREFLADVSSFANSGGGDLVFGMEEDKGVPVKVVGFQSGDQDSEILRLESIMNSGLDPRIRCALRIIDCGEGRKVLIIRVERSWSGPHRVIFKGHDKFYARHSAGKYALDVNELRTAFTLSATLIQRIRAFRTDRLIAISNNQTPVALHRSPKIVLHCIPLGSFGNSSQLNILPVYENPMRLRPMATHNWVQRLNLDGVLAHGTGDPATEYVQLYRDGTIEAVEGRILGRQYEGKATIPSIAYENYILNYLPHCLRLQQEIGAGVPTVVALTLTNTRGLTMGTDNYRFGFDLGHPIDAETVILPETVVEDLSTPPAKILQPMFDLVWNACGYPSSQNFDVDGNWIARA
jgi:hypothetical protein